MSLPASIGFVFSYWVLVVAVVALLLAQIAYFRTTPSVSGPLRVFLVSVRTVAFLAIVFLLMDPRCARRSETTDPGRVIALIDRSASMSLPNEGWESSASRSRFSTALELSAFVKESIEARNGEYQEVFFAGGSLTSSRDSLAPDGQGTDIVQALQQVYEKNEGENISSLVVFSDGIDTEEQLVRRSLPPVPVFTVGVGDTASPEDVRIKDVIYSSVVRTPSRAKIGATLFYSGEHRRHVRIRLIEDGTVVFEKDSVMSSAEREIAEEIPVEFPEAGRRNFTLEVNVDGYDAELENNRRDIVIEAEKAEAKVLVVDLQPDWELHFLTDLLRNDGSFDFNVISQHREASFAQGKIRPPNHFLALMEDSDALVIGSVTEAFLSTATTASIKRFVRERGGGLLVLPGPSSLFSLPSLWNQLDGLLPVRGTPPFQFTLRYTSLLPGAQAGTNPITAQLLPLLGQKGWQERSPLLGFYAPLFPRSGAEVLLETDERRMPAVAYHKAGKGRVAVVSAGPLWRWKFLSDGNAVYSEIMSRLLDVLARGEETERFFLTAKKNVFDAGESPVFIAEVFNEKMQPVTGFPLKIEISRVGKNGEEMPLERISMRRESVQSTRFSAAISPLHPGRYIVRGEAELPERTIFSRPIELKISDVSVEFQRMQQDRAALAAVAKRSGGLYAQGGDLADFSEKIPLEVRRMELVSELSLRTSVIVFLLVLVLLSIEWIVRKRVGMI